MKDQIEHFSIVLSAIELKRTVKKAIIYILKFMLN